MKVMSMDNTENMMYCFVLQNCINSISLDVRNICTYLSSRTVTINHFGRDLQYCKDKGVNRCF
jgi:hypothetical protein